MTTDSIDMLKDALSEIIALPNVAGKYTSERRILDAACRGIRCDIEEIIRRWELERTAKP